MKKTYRWAFYYANGMVKVTSSRNEALNLMEAGGWDTVRCERKSRKPRSPTARKRT